VRAPTETLSRRAEVRQHFRPPKEKGPGCGSGALLR